MDKRMDYIRENLIYEMKYVEYLEKQGLKEERIKEQLVRLRSFLDEFCIIGLGTSLKDMDKVNCIEDFFCLLDEKGTDSYELIRYASALSRFFRYMYEVGDISETLYNSIKEEIADSKEFTVMRADSKGRFI